MSFPFDLHDCGDVVADIVIVDFRRVALDDAFLLEVGDVVGDGGDGDVEFFGEAAKA